MTNAPRSGNKRKQMDAQQAMLLAQIKKKQKEEEEKAQRKDPVWWAMVELMEKDAEADAAVFFWVEAIAKRWEMKAKREDEKEKREKEKTDMEWLEETVVWMRDNNLTPDDLPAKRKRKRFRLNGASDDEKGE